MGRPDYIFGQFRETARCRDAQHGGRRGFAVLSHHTACFCFYFSFIAIVRTAAIKHCDETIPRCCKIS